MWRRYQKYVTDNQRKPKLEQIIVDFIHDRGLIIYGGLAIDRIIRNITVSGESLYDLEVKIPDYDVYSLDFVKDSEDLASILLKNGYDYVRIGSGMTGKTRKIWVDINPEASIDITQLSQFKYKKMKCSIIDDLIYADPQYLKIDQYQNLIWNLFKDQHRMSNALKKIQLLEKYFPIVDEIEENQSEDLEENREENREENQTENQTENQIELPETIADLHKKYEIILGGDYIFDTIYNELSESPDMYTGEIIIYSNELYHKEIPITGLKYNNIRILPILGTTFHNPYHINDITYYTTTQIGLLHTYYMLRFYLSTTKYDEKIKMLIMDPQTFRPYINGNVPFKIFTPNVDIVRNKIQFLPTKYLRI